MRDIFIEYLGTKENFRTLLENCKSDFNAITNKLDLNVDEVQDLPVNPFDGFAGITALDMNHSVIAGVWERNGDEHIIISLRLKSKTPNTRLYTCTLIMDSKLNWSRATHQVGIFDIFDDTLAGLKNIFEKKAEFVLA